MKKKIALLGATGQTGSIFLAKAIEKGHTVKVLVRDINKILITHERLHVIQGNVLNLTDVEKLVQDTNVVVSLFGHVKDSPDWLQTDGTKNIVSVMQKEGVQKIISLSGGGLPFPEKDEPKFVDKMIRFVMKMAVPKILNDAIAHHKVLESSGLKWVIVRGPRLTNDPSKGTYRVGWVGVNASTKIARGDLASFIFKQVESDEFIHQMPFVSY
ncbi:MAG: SDR family oxidoreductase [Bacteroidota bacterium]